MSTRTQTTNWRRILAVFFALVLSLSLSTSITASATQAEDTTQSAQVYYCDASGSLIPVSVPGNVSEKEVQPRFQYISNLSASVDKITEGGVTKARVTGSVSNYSAYSYDMTLVLEQSTNASSWSIVNSTTLSNISYKGKTGNSASWQIKSGYFYRGVTTALIEGGRERGAAYSGHIYY